jgi:NADPH-dependent curcumin reductase CurA
MADVKGEPTMTPASTQIRLRARPSGAPRLDDFEVVRVDVTAPGPGEVLVKTLWLSLDPYMRGRMNDGPSYARPVGLGEVMPGEVVGRIEASAADGLAPGALVRAASGWQTHAVHRADAVTLLPELGVPPQAHLGVLGMPGLTAYAGLTALGRPAPGETLVVAAATGPVGSLAGQLAKRRGLRAVGIAGGAEKAGWLAEVFGFDAGLDHRAAGFADALAAACPDGIDIYVELVGGHVLLAVRPLLNTHARVPVIGTVAHYNAATPPAGPDELPFFMREVLVKRLAVQGLIVWDYAHLRARFLDEVAPLVRSGEIRYLEDVVDGLDAAPAAFIGMLEGRNRGKLLVRVAADA